MKALAKVRAHLAVGFAAVLLMLMAIVGITASSTQVPTRTGTIDVTASQVVTVENTSDQPMHQIKVDDPQIETEARQKGLVLVCEDSSLVPRQKTRCGPGTAASLPAAEQVWSAMHSFGTAKWIAVEALALVIALAATIAGANRLAARQEQQVAPVVVDPYTGRRTWN